MSRLFSTRSGKLIVVVILLASLGLIIVQVQHVQNLLQNAQTPLTPPITSPEGKKNPISWSSPQVSLIADDFYIMADGKKFLGNAADIQVHSDPGSMAYTTLEATWFEGGVEMRINIYFDHREGDFWKVSEIRTYNGQTPGDWIYYKTIDGDSFLGNEFGLPLILPRLNLTSDSSNPDNLYSGTVYFENLRLWPFLTYVTPSSALPTVTLTPTPTVTPSPTITPTPRPKALKLALLCANTSSTIRWEIVNPNKISRAYTYEFRGRDAGPIVITKGSGAVTALGKSVVQTKRYRALNHMLVYVNGSLQASSAVQSTRVTSCK